MPYDFESPVDRRNTNSVKWDVKPNELPLSIADMDFRTAPEIVTAIQTRAQTGIFGYEEVPQSYFEAVAHWYRDQHDWQPKPEWMLFATGVVPTISSAVRRLSQIGDNVLIQSPVYNIFYNSILNNGRHVLSSDLVYTDGQYDVDWVDLETKMAEPLTSLMIFCNPHNPTGHIWSADELARIGALAAKHHVTVIADEIHGDITDTGYSYVPFASVNDVNAQNSVTCVSPSKTFNVAAMHAATVIVPNANLRAVVNRGLNSDELAEPNSFAIPASVAAYGQGAQWVAELRQVITAHKKQLTEFVATELPQVHVITGHATYLMWLDVSAVTADAAELAVFLQQQTGLIIADGNAYGPNGKAFIRISVACPTAELTDGLTRLKNGITAFQK